MNYSPNLYSGAYFIDIFSEILASNPTLNGSNGVRGIKDIKTETKITSLSGDLPLQAYSDNPSTPSDSFSFGDKLVKPIKVMTHARYSPEDFRFSRFQGSITKGALNVTSDELEQRLLTYAIPKVGNSMEKSIWMGVTQASKSSVTGGTGTSTLKSKVSSIASGQIDGLLVKASTDTEVVKLSGVTWTVSNLDTEFNRIYAALPFALVDNEETTIYAPKSAKQLINMANSAQLYRDKFTVAGDSYKYLGVKISFVDLPDSTALVGRSSDFVYATDTASDFGSFKTGFVTNEGDRRFMISMLTLDTAVLVPTQKILYA